MIIESKILNFKYYIIKFKELIHFFFSPDTKILFDLSVKDKLKDVFVFYVLNMIISIIGMFLIRQFIIEENMIVNKTKDGMSLINLFLFGVFIVPFLEEVVFRLSIVFKPIYLTVSSFLFTYIVVSNFYFKISSLNIDTAIYSRVLISVLVGVITYIITSKKKDVLILLWKIHFKWIYYISAILFGLIHIGNFELTLKNLLFSPLLTFPQLISGFFLGYVRTKYGFIYAFILHAIGNLIPVLL